MLALVGTQGGLGVAYLSALLLGAAQLVWQVKAGNIDDPADCLAKFKSNRLFGWLILAGIGLGGW